MATDKPMGGAGDHRFIGYDSVELALVNVPVDKHRVNAGESFRWNYNNTALGSAASIIHTFETSATLYFHMQKIELVNGTVGTSGNQPAVLLELREGSTISTAGTAVTPSNLNRLSSDVAQSTFATGANLNTPGTVVYTGVGGNPLWAVLATNTVYSLKLLNNGAATVNTNMEFQFAEQTYGLVS